MYVVKTRLFFTLFLFLSWCFAPSVSLASPFPGTVADFPISFTSSGFSDWTVYPSGNGNFIVVYANSTSGITFTDSTHITRTGWEVANYIFYIDPTGALLSDWGNNPSWVPLEYYGIEADILMSSSSPSPSAITWQIPDNIPGKVPFTYNGKIYDHFLMWHAPNGQNADDWHIMYTNISDFYLNQDWYLPGVGTDNDVVYCDTTHGQNPDWSCFEQVDAFATDPGFYPFWTVYGLYCAGTGYSDHTVFVQVPSPFLPPASSGVPDYGTVCQDLWPTGTKADFPDVLMHRLIVDNSGNISGFTPPGSEVIFSGNDTSDYVEVPSPVTDPGGFVSALLTNMALWLKNLIVPPDNYFANNYDSIKSAFDTKFAFYSQLQTAFVIPQASNFSPITLGSLSLGGSQTAPIAFISSFDPNEFASFRTFFSMVLYVGLGFFLIRKMSNIFSS